MSPSTRREKLAVCLSLANLAFVPSWLELLFADPSTPYYVKRLPVAADHLAAIVDVLVAAAILFGLAVLSERSRVARALFAVGVVIAVATPLNAFRMMLPRELGVGRMLSQGLMVVLPFCVAAAWLLYRFRNRLWRVAKVALSVLAPFSIVTIGRSLFAAATIQASPMIVQPPLSKPSALPPPSGYVVWMIFDELDFRVAFDARPKRIALPELDRLRGEALFATDAYPPATETIRSLPSLLSGRVVTDAVVAGADDLSLSFVGEPTPLRWKSIPSVFAEAQARGAETGVVGWYHPYCRVLASSLTRCRWHTVYQSVLGRVESESFLSSMLVQVGNLSPFGSRKLHRDAYDRVLEDAKAMLAEQKRGVLFFHFPVPHSPSIYDANQKKTTVTNLSNVVGYADNLALADRTLGEVRRVMESLGTWDRAHIILSADHPWRQSKAYDGKSDPRVPFIVKVAGQKTGIELPHRLETVQTGRLALELVTTSSASVDRVVEWLERSSTALADKSER